MFFHSFFVIVIIIILSTGISTFPLSFNVTVETVVKFDGTLWVTPESFCRDDKGNFFVVDSTSHVVLLLPAILDAKKNLTYLENNTSIVAGRMGASGLENGVAERAIFNTPKGISCPGSFEYLYVSDFKNNQIRKVDLNNPKANTFVSTFVGSSTSGLRDAQGSYARFSGPAGLSFDRVNQDFYLADSGNHAIRRISINGKAALLAGNGIAGYVDQTKTSAMFSSPRGVALDSKTGVLYVADTNNHVIRRISTEGSVATLAGSGKNGFKDGKGREAAFNLPFSLVLLGNGHLFVADQGNFAVRRVMHDGTVLTMTAGVFGKIMGIIADVNDNMYILDTALGSSNGDKSVFHAIRQLNIVEIGNDNDDDGKDTTVATNPANLIQLVVISILATSSGVIAVVSGALLAKRIHAARFRQVNIDDGDERTNIVAGTVNRDVSTGSLRPPPETNDEFLPPYSSEEQVNLNVESHTVTVTVTSTATNNGNANGIMDANEEDDLDPLIHQ